jgi:hypothetical protein
VPQSISENGSTTDGLVISSSTVPFLRGKSDRPFQKNKMVVADQSNCDVVISEDPKGEPFLICGEACACKQVPKNCEVLIDWLSDWTRFRGQLKILTLDGWSRNLSNVII